MQAFFSVSLVIVIVGGGGAYFPILMADFQSIQPFHVCHKRSHATLNKLKWIWFNQKPLKQLEMWEMEIKRMKMDCMPIVAYQKGLARGNTNKQTNNSSSSSKKNAHEKKQKFRYRQALSGLFC